LEGDHRMRRCFYLIAIIAVFVSALPFRYVPTAHAQGKPDLVWMRGGHNQSTAAVAYSPDGTMIASGDSDGTTKVWRSADGMLLRTFPGRAEFVKFTPDGKQLVAADTGLARVWQIADGKLLSTMTGYSSFWSSYNQLPVALSSDGQMLAVSNDSSDGSSHTIMLFRVRDGQLLNTLTGHTGQVFSLAFSPDGRWLVSGSGVTTLDTALHIWQTATGSLVKTLPFPLNGTGSTYQIGFSPDGSTLYAGRFGGAIYVWRVADWQLQPNAYMLVGSMLVISPDGQMLFNGEALYSLSDFHELSTTDSLQLGAPILAAAFSPDGKTLAAAIGNAGTYASSILLLQTPGLTFQQDITRPGGAAPVWNTVVSPDGKIIASAVRGHGPIVLQRASDGTFLGTIPNDLAYGLAFTPDSKQLVGPYGGYSDSRFGLWNVSDGSLARTFDVGTTFGSDRKAAAISPDGTLLACAAYYNITIFRIQDGSVVQTIPDTSQTPLAFSPDGQYLATPYHLWRISDGQQVRSWSYHYPEQPDGRPTSLAFSPDGTKLAICLSANYVNIFDTSTGNSLFEVGNGGTYTSVAFSPDGASLAAGRSDWHLDFFSAQDGSPLTTYDQETIGNDGSGGYFGGVESLAYSPDGKFLYYGRGDDTVCCALNPHIARAFPNHGGNTGNVNVKIVTSDTFPVTDGTTVTLTANNMPPITTAATVVRNPNQATGHILEMTFNLNGAPIGVRDVVISVPGGGTHTYPQGFTIEQGIAPQITTDIIGPSNLRAGPYQTYEAVFSNTGNVDASVADLRIEFPNWFKWQSGGYQAQDVFTGDNSTSISIQVPVVPAGGSVTVPIQVAVADVSQNAHRPFRISSWVNSNPDVSITYLGNLTEELVMRAVGSDHTAIEYLGRLNSTGIVSSISSLRVTAPDGTVSIINLNRDGWPAQILDSSGNGANIAYPDPTSIIFSPLSQEIPIDMPIVYHPVPPLAVFPPFAPLPQLGGGPGGFNPCDLAKIAYQLDSWNHALQGRFGDIGNAIGIGAVFVAAKFSNAGLAASAGALSTGATAAGAFFGFSYFYDKWHTLRDLGDLLTNVFNCFQTNTSGDPNDLEGLAGFGLPKWIAGTQPLVYTTFFSNEPTALAAQQITVTDYLDPISLDTSSVRLGVITIGNKQVTPTAETTPPVGTRQFDYDLDLRPDNNIIAHIHASLDMLLGTLTYQFTSLDPATGLPTTDPLAGLLPAGVEGSVQFLVTPKSSAPTGTIVQNQASVVFDYNPAMNTPVWSNTLDNDKPISQVQTLPATSNSNSINVQWAGTDVGSGLKDFTVSVSDNGGPFTPWQTNTTFTEAVFNGAYGHTYAFESTARDNAGNVEAMHSTPDASTSLTEGNDTLTVADAVGTIGFPTTLSAVLLRSSDNKPLPNRHLQFSVENIPVGSAVTDATGTASISYLVTAWPFPAPLTIKVVRLADGYSDAITSYGTLTVAPADTAVSVANVSATIGQTVTLSATLARTTDNAVLPGRSLSFYVADAYVGTVSTDGTGTAQISYTLSQALTPGPQTIKVVRLGNSQYNANTGTGTLTVSASDTSVTVAPVSGKAGQTVTLSAVLRRSSDNAVLPGRDLSFYVNNAYVGTVSTDGTGTAQVSYTIPSNLSAGTQQSITVKRAANAQYNASQGTGTLTVTP
jgi:WD40 repeat protein